MAGLEIDWRDHEQFERWLDWLEGISSQGELLHVTELAARNVELQRALIDKPRLAADLQQRLDQLRAIDQMLGLASLTPNGFPVVPGFVIGGVLGHGGAGVVYSAKQNSLGRKVALKLMLGGRFASPRSRERFRREAHTAARLQHPNIVQVHDYGEVDGLPYLAEELIRGGTLADRIAAGGYSPHDAAELLETLAGAIHYAHQNGVIHRDLKPSNVLLSESGEVKVADFGLAKSLDLAGVAMTHTGEAPGTPSYMAPEQIAGSTVDARTDVYGLGTILYELLTGEPPFQGMSAADVFVKVGQVSPTAPWRKVRRCPVELGAIALKCLEKRPERRYVSAAALAHDLRRWLDGEPTVAKPLSVTRRLASWARRRPATATASALSLASVVALAVVVSAYTVRLRELIVLAEVQRTEAQRQRDRSEQSARAAQESARVAREDQARVREHVYVSDMRIAQQLRDDGDLASLPGLLDRYRDPSKESSKHVAESFSTNVTERGGLNGETSRDLRGFEWYYFNRFRDARRLTIAAHTSDVDLLVFSSRGDVLATASAKEGRVRLWEIPSCRQLGTFSVRTKPAPHAQENLAAISPNGDRLATLIDTSTIVVWCVESQEELSRFRDEQTIHAIAFLSDGTRVAVGGDKETLIWDCETKEVVSKYGAARLVAASPDGCKLGLVDAPRASNATRIWDLSTGVCERCFTWAGPVRQIEFSPDGKLLASLVELPLSNEMYIVDPHSGARLHGFSGRGDRFMPVGFARDSRQGTAMAADGSLRFWDTQSGESRGALREPAKRLTRFAHSSGSRWLATADSGGTVSVWDARLLPACDELLPINDVIGPVAFSHDGKLLAAATRDHCIVLVNVKSNQVDRRLKSHTDRIRDLCFSPDSQKLLTTDGQFVSCWNCSDGEPVWTISEHAKFVSWSERSDVVVLGGVDNSIRLYDPNDGSEVANLLGFGINELTGMRVVPDTNLVMATNSDSLVYFLDLAGRAIAHSEKLDVAIDEFVLSADGKSLAAAMRNGALRVWSFDASRQLGSPLYEIAGQGGCPSSFALSPDGNVLGKAGPSGILEALSVPGCEHLYTLSGRRVGGAGVTYSPDGKILATISRTGCLTLWDLSSWQTRTLDGSPLLAARSVAFSPDSSRIAIGIDDETAMDLPTTDNLPVGPNVRMFASRRSPIKILTNRPVFVDERPWDIGVGGLRRWNLGSGEEQPLQGECSTLMAMPIVAWSSRDVIAVGGNDGTVGIWKPNQRESLTRFPVGQRSADLVTSPGQPSRAMVSQTMLKRLDRIVALTFSPKGERLAVATQNGTILVADASDWNQRVTLCTDATRVACLAFSPSGSMLFANRRGQLLCWNLDNKENSANPCAIGQEADADLGSAAFARDGRTLALGRQDGTIELVDVAAITGSKAVGPDELHHRTLKGHLDRVAALSFSHDNRTLASGSWDTTVRLWHVVSGQEVAVFKAHHGKVEAVAFSPDGTVLATGGQRDVDHGEVFLWRALP